MHPTFQTPAFIFTAATMLCPLTLAADSFDVRSNVIKATLYPQGAQVTRKAQVSLPAGTHELVFFDIPADYEHALPDGLQARVNGAEIGPMTVKNERPKRDDTVESGAVLAAQNLVSQLEEKHALLERDVQAISLEGKAADDALSFINGLSAPEDASAEDIINFARAIQTQSLEARLAIQDTALRIKAAVDALEQSVGELERARAALALLVTKSEFRSRITLQVEAEEPGDVDVEFTYLEQGAAWQPTYQAHVDTVEDTLILKRSIAAVQKTGEPWIDVALSFGTDRPAMQTAPSVVGEWVRRVTDPEDIRLVKTARTQLDAPMMAAEVAIESFGNVVSPSSYGLNLSYQYEGVATLYSASNTETEFAIEPLIFEPDLYVRAVPLYDQTGFLVADVSNASGEAILPGNVTLFRDGAFIGDTHLAMQPDGSNFEIGFGALEGIRVDRVTLDRNEGDRGFISKSNETTSNVRLEVENLTSRVWPIELLDRVSVSEQGDLRIEWTASLAPSEENVDDKRGVLAWRFELNAGEQNEVTLEEKLTWPEDHLLR